MKLYQIKVLVFLTAFNGFVTELILSYIMGVFFGSFVKQVLIIFSVYIFSMGLGALVFDKVKVLKISFEKLQTSLSILSSAFPFLLWISFKFLTFPVIFTLTIFASILLGILSGLEFPILNKLADEVSPSKNNFYSLLALDYLGMSFASAIFAFAMIRYFGVLPTISIVSVIYLFNSTYFSFKKIVNSKIHYLNFGIFISLVVMMFLSKDIENSLNRWMF